MNTFVSHCAGARRQHVAKPSALGKRQVQIWIFSIHIPLLQHSSLLKSFCSSTSHGHIAHRFDGVNFRVTPWHSQMLDTAAIVGAAADRQGSVFQLQAKMTSAEYKDLHKRMGPDVVPDTPWEREKVSEKAFYGSVGTRAEASAKEPATFTRRKSAAAGTATAAAPRQSARVTRQAAKANQASQYLYVSAVSRLKVPCRSSLGPCHLPC